MSSFIDKLKNIDWNARKEDFFQHNDNQLNEMEECFQILAHWSQSLETIYQNNLALPFIREAQVSAQDFISVYSLSLYKSSAASMRVVFESILYFSYFKDHLVELKSVTNKKFYLNRTQIINYHLEHTENFNSIYDRTSLKNKVDQMYSDISNLVHSSQPGIWHQKTVLGEKEYNSRIAKETAKLFIDIITVVNLLLLCIVTYDEWLTIPIVSRKIFLDKITESQFNLINKTAF